MSTNVILVTTAVIAAVTVAAGANLLTSSPSFGTDPCDLDFRPGVSSIDVVGRALPHNCETVRIKHYLDDGTTFIETTSAQVLPLRMIQRVHPYKTNGLNMLTATPDQIRKIMQP